jgi:hypothetical protein
MPPGGRFGLRFNLMIHLQQSGPLRVVQHGGLITLEMPVFWLASELESEMEGLLGFGGSSATI